MSWLFCAVALIYLVSCGESPINSRSPDLNTRSHSRHGLTYGDSPIEVDTRWRFVSSKNTIAGVEVTGAWEITLRNPSSSDWNFWISRFSFLDAQGFQIVEYSSNDDWIETLMIEAGETDTWYGNFTISLKSIDLANTITNMSVWASVWK